MRYYTHASGFLLARRREQSGAVYREIFWLISDHLGTPRMIAKRTGSLTGIKRNDYLPFGEPIHAGVGGRATTQGYVTESVRQGFGGYEEDGETGLDYAKVRYYGSKMGRFGSVDPLLTSGQLRQPQSWNRYTYTLNSPLKYTDPTGLFRWSSDNYHEPAQWDDKGSNNSVHKPSGGRIEPSLGGQGIDRIKQMYLNSLVNFRDDTMNYVMSGWRRVTENGKDRFEWSDDPNVNDVPLNYRYIAIDGRAIQLWGDHSKPAGQINHGWQVVSPSEIQGSATYTEQSGDAPNAPVSYADTVTALQGSGYLQGFSIHPSHYGGTDFYQPVSPTLHVTVFPEIDDGWFSNTTLGGSRPRGIEFHSDRNTVTGGWGDWVVHTAWDWW